MPNRHLIDEMVKASPEVEKEVTDERSPCFWRLSVHEEAQTDEPCGMVRFANYSCGITRYVIRLSLSKGTQVLFGATQLEGVAVQGSNLGWHTMLCAG
jgi:hypothetical protein